MLLRFSVAIGIVAVCSCVALGQEDAWRIQWGHQQPLDRFFSEGIATGDIDSDGHIDLVVGPFWIAGPDFMDRHRVEAGEPVDPHGYAPHFFSFTDDFDADADLDILQIGFPGQAAYWLENPGMGAEGAWVRHPVIDRVDNESPTYKDLTGDGRRELICSRNGKFGYVTPDPNDAHQPWIFHAISADGAGGQFTHGLGIGDIDGDGRTDLLEKSGWWRQPASLEGDPLWTKHPFEFAAAGGSQMFAEDFDGDGDSDVVTALAAHGYGVAWYEQIREGERIGFERHLIVGSTPSETRFGVVFSQPHALAVADIDGDGLSDIVTGKRTWAHGPHGDVESLATPVLYWFRCVRDADGGTYFEPHLVSEGTGVGVDVVVDDVNKDGWADIVVANKQGVFVHRQDRTNVDADAVERLRLVSAENAAQPLPAARLPESGLAPIEAAAQFTVPDGFAVDLIAGEPDLHQPVAFCFDSRGRIWVAEAYTYPERAPEGQGRDKIRIFEDTDGDGSFETRKTFAEGLNLVSGLQVGYGGVWVGAAPYLMFIPDADGDDRPDAEPRILLDGFGHQDTHETLNAFTWGPDGWLYGCQGVFIHSRVGPPGSPEAERTPMNAGVWRYHPVLQKFEVFASGTSNPWGVTFDENGQALITACVIPHAYHMIQGGRYQRQAGQHFNPYTFEDLDTIADHVHYAGDIRDHAWWGRDEPVEDDATSAAGGGHAHCGALIYYGDDWPIAYRGALLMHNLHGNRINMDLLRGDGTGFIASHGRDVVFANDPWFRGISLQSGPDGALYVIDWYDKNACHRTTPEIWDRTNGRMYRVRFGELSPRGENLRAADNDRLVALQGDDNDWHVRTARRVLAERAAAGQDLSDVRRILLDKVTSADTTALRLRHLWAAHGIAPVATPESLRLLDHPDPMVRAWTIQLACERGTPDASVLARLAEMATQDREPVVHLYLASALQRIAGDDSAADARWAIAEGLLARGDSQFDRNLPLMIWYAVSPLVPENPSRAFALARQTAIPMIRQYIFRRAASDPKLVGPLVSAIADEADDKLVQLMVAELSAAAPRLGKIEMPADWPKVVQRTKDMQNQETGRAVQSLSVSFGDSSVYPILRKVVTDPELDVAVRRDALDTLARGGDPQLRELAVRLLDDPQLRADALPLLGRFDDASIPELILQRYPDMNPAMKRIALDTLASRPSHAVALLDAIENGTVPRTDVTAVHAAKIRELDDGALQQRLAELWGVVGSTPAETEKQIASMKATYTPGALALANPSRGRLLYNQSCGQCHRLFGEGGDIGPDLTGSNRTNMDYLLENILAPNAIVGKDYQAISVLTLDGRVVTGLLRQETDAAIVLHDAEKLVTIPKSEIDDISNTVRSVMPEGILQPFTDQQVGDLLAYLQSPSQVPLAGNVPEIDASTGRVPGAIEAETLEGVEASFGSTSRQSMASFPQGRWSGGDQLWWTGGKPGATLSLPFQVERGGKYELSIALTQARDYGVIHIAVDGTRVVEGLDLYDKNRVLATGPLSLGTMDLEASDHEVTITIAGANPNAVPAMMVGVDYIYLAPH